MAYNVYHKLVTNIEAIRIALEWKEGDELNSSQTELLKNYSGFGGIKAVLYPDASIEEWKQLNATESDLRLYRDVLELYAVLKEHFNDKAYKEVLDSLKNSVLTAFYTPPVIPQTLYDVLKRQGMHPGSIYEPSAGAGIFITEAVKAFEEIQKITAVEKDILTGKVLQALCGSLSTPVNVQIKGLEETSQNENDSYELIVSNIPFGNFQVFDPVMKDAVTTGKIHNYFFAKGMGKIADGGLLAYITTDAFLNNPSNEPARTYLFTQADFISLRVLPDNLMKETGNTEAPSHLLIVQKNKDKEDLSEEEKLLIETIEQQNEFGSYSINRFISHHPEIIIGNEIAAGKNQYGKAHQKVWQHGDINEIRGKLETGLTADFTNRFNKKRYELSLLKTTVVPTPHLTLLPIPENKPDHTSVQLGLFDSGAAENINRAMAYITDLDATVVEKNTARIVNIIRTKENTDHETFVLITARAINFKHYVYKLYSNASEIEFPANWMNAAALSHQINHLSSQLKEFNHQFYNDGASLFHVPINEDGHLTELTNLPSFYKEGTLLVHEGKIGFASFITTENRQPVFLPSMQESKDVEFYKDYTILRDSYFLVLGNEEKRSRLNELYDAFVANHGLLNTPVNSRRITKDEAFGGMILASLERKEGERYVKADILTEPLVQHKELFRTDDPVEALAHCLNDQGKVDIDFIAAATGLTNDETITALSTHIYLNPSTNCFETSDQFLSGNVVSKLKIAEERLKKEPQNIQLKKSFDALGKTQPEKIPFELLDFNLGERWIPIEYYNRFATDLFEITTTVSYFSSVDSFKVKPDGRNAKTDQEYAVTTKTGSTTYGNKLLEHALENTTPFYTYEIQKADKKIRVPDNDAIQLAHQKIDSIRNQFIAWLNELPQADKKKIEDLYNDTFNCYVLREYNGNHLTFPGLDFKKLGIEDLYSSQKNSVWRIIQNRGALIDHEVGLGKTLTMVVASHEMKRLKIIQKPAILAMKSNVRQITETYRKAYPKDRILAPDENDFTPAKRLRLFHEIKNNNWDCIILTHDQFGKIPQSVEIQREILENELDNLERDLRTLKDLGGEISKRMLKGLEIRRANLQTRLAVLLKDIEQKKDAGIDFKSMGIDHLFVDESHKFKNLTFTTRHDRVAGLGNMEGSQKALNMLFTVRTLQKKFNADLCVTFLSGTPISNSLTEMYLIFKYLRPNEMRRQRIENFDAWAAVFARKTTDFEFSVTNEIIAKERFRHFIKVPELALFYNEITDYKTAKHIRLDKPGLDEALVNLKPTPDQREFIKRLMAFAKTGDGSLIGRSPLTQEEDKGRMLIATNYAKKMAVDMRLINEHLYEDHPGNKVNECARKVAEIYHYTKDKKGTQIIFCDIGTPKDDAFNVYDALKEKLSRDFDIPSYQISFIHDWTDKQKPELFRKMNAGEIRVLIGSTEKAGTGLNVQKKVIAMHHLDIPWKPAELEQRNGRGARQGNILAKEHYGNNVKNYIYAVEQSLDNYKFNLLKNKQTFISQMKNCELNVRTIDEGAIDEKGGMNFSEYIAILSGDTTLLEKCKIEKKIAVLESLRNAHHREVARSRFQLEHLQEEKDKATSTLKKLSSDYQFYKEKLKFDKEGTKLNPIEIVGIRSTDPEVIGKHLIHLSHYWKPEKSQSEEKKIGSLYGFDLYIVQQKAVYEESGTFQYHYSNAFYAEREQNGIKYSINQGRLNIDNPKLAARYFLNAIDRVEALKEKYEQTVKEHEGNIPTLKQLTEKSFEKEKELQSLKTDLARLEREIGLKIQKQQMSEEEKVEIKETKVIQMNPGAMEKKNEELIRKVKVKKRRGMSL